MPATKKAAAKLPARTEPIPVQADVETWRNDTSGIVTINRVGEYGRKLVDLVHGGRTFQITPQERRMNQSACASAELDFFTNGTLRPINLLDDEPDTEILRRNPNTLTDDDLRAIFRLKGEVFRQRIAEVTNPLVLTRLTEASRDPRYDASLFQYETVKSRELELKGEIDTGEPPREREVIGRGVTPK